MKQTLLSTFVLLTILLTACGGTPTSAPTAEPTAEVKPSNSVTAEGTLIPDPSVELAFAQGGVVKEIFVHPGDQVAEGDVLVQLVGIEAAKAELASAELELIVAQQVLDALNENAPAVTAQTQLALANAAKALDDEMYRWRVQQKDNRASPETIREAEAKLKLAEDEVERCQGIYNRVSGDSAKAMALVQLTQAKRNRDAALRNLNWYRGKPTDLDQAVLDAKLSLAQAQLEDARQAWEHVKDGPNADDIAKAQASLTLAQEHLVAAKSAFELYELRAPFSGILLSLDLTRGESVTPTLPIAYLANTSRWIVETKDLAEIDVSEISIGDPVSIKLDAFPGEEFGGKVTKINPVGRLYLGDMTYQITVTLDEPDTCFLWNMTATVSVNAEGN